MSATTEIPPESSVSITERPLARDILMELQNLQSGSVELGGTNNLIGSGDGTGILSKRRAVVLVVTVAGVNFLNTMCSGILTVALPTIAKSVGLSAELFLWPASIYALTSGCTLLFIGTIADILGRRITFLTGTGLYSTFTLGCALAKTGPALITFRALQGVSISLCLTTGMGIISTSFPLEKLKQKSTAISIMGAASPVGYGVGLALSGVFVQSASWRAAFYFAAGVNVVLLTSAVWGLPNDEKGEKGSVWGRLKSEIDWVGVLLATVSISLLSYVMAVVTGKAASIREVQNIVLLSVALLLMLSFSLWIREQGDKAIIPNSVWKESAFTTACIVVFLTCGAFNCFGYFATLFFQEIQILSPLQTSLRLLPTAVCGILANIATRFLVESTSASYLVAVSSIFSAIACLLMAIISPRWTYWAVGFPAVFLSPMSTDVLFTISGIIITEQFESSKHKQSLAGGIFYTVSQIGNSVGLTIGAVIAASVTAGSSTPDSKVSLEKGFRATFWTCFAGLAVVAVVSFVGLKKRGKVGIKMA